MKRMLLTSMIVIVVGLAFAETRDPNSPYSPGELKKMSTLVFTGRVLKTETDVDHNVSFPVEAKVEKVVKGRTKEEKLSFTHKHPGKHVIIDKEYNTPKVGQVGTFYIQDQNGTLLLIGYITKTEQGT